MWRPNVWNVQRGSDYQILVHLINAVDGDCINITGATEIDLLLRNADGSVLKQRAYTGMACGLSDTMWIYAFLLTGSQTAALPLIQSAQLEIQVYWGTQTQKFTIQSTFSTFDPPL